MTNLEEIEKMFQEWKNADNKPLLKKIKVTEKNILVIKRSWIFIDLLLKFFIRFLIIIFLFILIKIPIVSDFIKTYYLLHYLFIFGLFLLAVEFLFFVLNILSDLSDILLKYVAIVKKVEEKIED